LQRVRRAHVLEEELVLLGVEEEAQPLLDREPEVELALRAHLPIALDLPEVERLAAPVALQEEPLAERGRGLRIARLTGSPRLLEPHRSAEFTARRGAAAGPRPAMAPPGPRRRRAPSGAGP